MKQPLYATSAEAGSAAQPKVFQALVLGRRLGRFRANQTLLAQFVRALALRLFGIGRCHDWPPSRKRRHRTLGCAGGRDIPRLCSDHGRLGRRDLGER